MEISVIVKYHSVIHLKGCGKIFPYTIYSIQFINDFLLAGNLVNNCFERFTLAFRTRSLYST